MQAVNVITKACLWHMFCDLDHSLRIAIESHLRKHSMGYERVVDQIRGDLKSDDCVFSE